MAFVGNDKSNFAKYPESQAINNYKDIAMNMLHLNFPLLTEEELSAAIDNSISNHFKDTDITINNNYKNATIQMTLRSLVEYIESREPIITSYGVLFNKHASIPNPIYNLVDSFVNTRKSMKKEMFKYPKGTEMFEKYNLLQLLAKIDVNGYYGATGMYSCIYYNLYCSASTTTQGRSAISAAALFFESFMNNNVPFGSMNELIEFINNVLRQERNYNSNDIITNHASLEETFFQLMSTTGFGWIPTEDEMFIVWEILNGLGQDDLDRLFYKNNLFNFVDNPYIKQAILYILQSLKQPFMDPNNPPEEIKIPLMELYGVLKEYVYYDKQIIDRMEKMTSLIRSVSIIQDTD